MNISAMETVRQAYQTPRIITWALTQVFGNAHRLCCHCPPGPRDTVGALMSVKYGQHPDDNIK